MKSKKLYSPIIILVFIIFSLITSSEGARIYIDIDAPSLRKLPVAVPIFKPLDWNNRNDVIAREGAKIISNDLTFSDYFKVLDPRSFLKKPDKIGLKLKEINFRAWDTIGAEILVRGGYRLSGGILTLEMHLYDVFARKELLAIRYEGRRDQLKEMIRRFEDEMMKVLTGEPGIFSTKIAFVSNHTGHKEIYIADFDGTNIVQLTNFKSITLSPRWSPDGRYIVFTSYKNGAPKLYKMDLKTKRVTLIAGRSSLNITPSWSPKGDSIALTMNINDDPEICLISPNGVFKKRLTRSWGIDVSPSWSPDGKSLAFVSKRSGSPQIYVMNLMTGIIKRLTFEGRYNTSPCWSPRGDKIVFTRQESGAFDLFLINPSTEEESQITFDGMNEEPYFSPNGRLIVFTSRRYGTYDIMVMNSNGTNLRRLIHMKGDQKSPAWSPVLKTKF